MSKPVVYVCRGTSCRKRKKAGAALREELSAAVKVKEIACQDICEGPVAGTRVQGAIEWFREVDGPKSRRALVALALGGALSELPKPLAKPLAKRRVARRSGKGP